MPKEVVSTPKAPKALAAYSHGTNAAGLVFVAGQGPLDPATGEVVSAIVQEEPASVSSQL
jgi:2-iminobutanoate/2-iminopropanoate deaminase